MGAGGNSHRGMVTPPQAKEHTHMTHTHVLTDTRPQKYFSLIFLLGINPLPTYAYVYALCEYLVHPEVRGQVRSKVADEDEPPSRFLESKPASLQKQQLCVSSEPSVQLLALTCLLIWHSMASELIYSLDRVTQKYTLLYDHLCTLKRISFDLAFSCILGVSFLCPTQPLLSS